MNSFLAELSFKISDVPTTGGSTFFTPPSWPPPQDWVVSFDLEGSPVSRWGDTTWDFSAWAGKSLKIQFLKVKGRRSIGTLDPRNRELLRLATTYLIWGPRGVRNWTSLRNVYNLIRRLVTFCDEQNVYTGDLSRFPKLHSELGRVFQHSQDRKVIVLWLDRLLRASQSLDFAILDEYSLAQVANAFKDNKPDDTEQTAYIPPRIWLHQITRLRECLDDFLLHADAYEACYNFCLDAYAHNYGSLEKAFTNSEQRDNALLPFGNKHVKRPRPGLVYHGTFEEVALRFGIAKLLQKWVAPAKDALSVKSLSTYAGLIQMAVVCYIANFTLQRKEEVADLRLDCLLWDEDPILGRIAIIRGETTKTDPDSDARWPASPSVEIAVLAGTRIARTRLRAVVANPLLEYSAYDLENPAFLQFNVEPWGGRWDGRCSIRISTPAYSEVFRRFPRLFDAQTLQITEEDLINAKMFTPNLGSDVFRIGNVWPLAFHQLRRTGGINMFASGILSASSIQVIMKHLTLLQTMYYGQHFSSARFNEEVEGVTSSARFEVLAKQIESLMNERYVSPQGESRKEQIVVNLVADRDYKKLVQAGASGEVAFRETRLGGCAKKGDCEYGGIESIASCAGFGNRKPCAEAIFDKQRRPAIGAQLIDVERRLSKLNDDSPRRRALVAEAEGMRNYLDVTGN